MQYVQLHASLEMPGIEIVVGLFDPLAGSEDEKKTQKNNTLHTLKIENRLFEMIESEGICSFKISLEGSPYDRKFALHIAK